MAGDWMKFEKSTLEKPEVLEIANALNLDVDAVIGKLLRVWNWFDDHTTDGNAPVTVRALLDRYTGVTGFVTAMSHVGWMIESNDRLILPNFDRHNGATSKKRALGAIRQANHRVGNAKSNAENNAHGVTKALPEKRREEKRREDIVLPIGKTKKRESRSDDSDLQFPFESSEFQSTWGLWEQHLKEKKKPLSKTAKKMQFGKLLDMGESRAIAALKYSIMNGWQGIFEEKAQPNASRPMNFGTSNRIHANDKSALDDDVSTSSLNIMTFTDA